MSISGVIAALQAKHASVAGITSAPTQYPTGLNSTSLPCAITDALKGKTDWESHGGDYTLEIRSYRVRVFCLPAGQGAGFDQGKQLAITILDAMLASYRSSPNLTSTAAVRIEAGVEDTGVRANMTYADPDTPYYGFELLVSVEERWESA